MGRSYQRINEEKIEYIIGSLVGEPMKFEILHVSISGLIFHRPKELYVMSMLDEFNMLVLGNHKWLENWEALAKKDPRKAEEKIRSNWKSKI